MWNDWRRSTNCGPAGRLIPLFIVLLACTLAGCSTGAPAARKPTTTATTTPMPTGWNAVLSPRVGAEGNLTAVSARSANDAWAVGQYEGINSLQRTLVEHWGGSQWSVVASPSPGAEFNVLQGVSMV
jgi:hypothetical protein